MKMTRTINYHIASQFKTTNASSRWDKIIDAFFLCVNLNIAIPKIISTIKFLSSFRSGGLIQKLKVVK